MVSNKCDDCVIGFYADDPGGWGWGVYEIRESRLCEIDMNPKHMNKYCPNCGHKINVKIPESKEEFVFGCDNFGNKNE